MLVEELMRSPAPARVARALDEPRAPTSLGGKGNGRRTEGIGPSHRQQGNGQHGKGFGAKTVTYRSTGATAEKGEGSRTPAASQVGAGMPIVTAWEASVTP